MAIHHIALRTRDVPALASFYRTLFGLEVVRRQGDHSVWLDADPTILMIEEAGDDEPPIPQGSMEFLALSVTQAQARDLDERLSAASIELEHQTEHTRYLRDPDGRRVGYSWYPSSAHSE